MWLSKALFGLLITLLASFGEAQQQCTSILDLAFIVDNSGSIRDGNPSDLSYDNWDLAKNFVKNLVSRLPVSETGTRVGLVHFSNVGKVEFNLDSYRTKAQVEEAVMKLGYIGSNTNTSGGLLVAKNEIFNSLRGDRMNVPNVAIVITDGKSTYDKEKTLESAKALKDAGVKVFVVGVSDKVVESELAAISSAPNKLDENYFKSVDFRRLYEIVDKVIAETCKPVVDVCDRREIDVVFVLDSSDGIRQFNPFDQSYDNWALLLQFVVNVVDQLEIGPARIGVVKFADRAQNVMFLNSYADKQSIMNEIFRISFTGGNRNIAEGLRVMHTEQFSFLRGDRSNIQNIAIVLTGGSSSMDGNKVIPEAQLARQKGIRIFGVGITSGVDELELKGMSSIPQELDKQYWVSLDFQGLGSIVDNLAKEACAPVKQEFENVVDLVIILDASESVRSSIQMGYDNWELMKQFAADFVDRFTVGFSQTNIGVVVFSNTARSVMYLNSLYDKESIKSQIMSIDFMGGFSNVAAAIREMHYNQFVSFRGDRFGVYNYALLITDGRADIDASMVLSDAAQAKLSGIRILSVGIGPNVDRYELSQISSGPGIERQNYWMVSDYLALANLRESILLETLVTTSSPVEPSTVPTMRPPVTASPGCSKTVVDMVFVLDNSGSIRDNNPSDSSYDNWQLLLDFVKNIIKMLNIGPDESRVGVVSYSLDAKSMFYLDTHFSQSSLLAAVDNIPYIGSYTNTSGGLREMLLNQFSVRNGDRVNVPDLAIVITDGESNIDQTRTLTDAIAARARGIKILSVGITDKVNEKEVREISSMPQREGETYWRSADFKLLGDIVNAIVSETCAAPAVHGDTGATGRPGDNGAPGRKGDAGSPGLPGRDGQIGATGIEGRQGATGFPGAPGSFGLDGDTGETGLPGRSGLDGRDGLPGSTGLQGATGLPGFGRDGATGATGREGRVGAPGATGRQGFEGLNGATGFPGANGFPGATGTSGQRGIPGRDGRPGFSGATGLSGRVGEPGATGLPGRDGLAGATGRDGRIGSPGAPGSTGFPGSSGRDGLDGLPGSTGFTGFAGRDGALGATGFPGRDGRKGDTGQAGFSGRDGAPGEQGFIGRPGATGARGVQGRPGSDGRQGAQGLLGLSGATGRQGVVGLPGRDGRVGDAGFTGPTGRTGGTGSRGFPGNPGATGQPGFNGRDGLSGLQGVAGSTGRRGNPGRDGRVGGTGYTGFAGLHGFTGSQGRPGAAGFPGRQGATGIGNVGATGLVGPQGQRGLPGPAGINGKTGATGREGLQGLAGPDGRIGTIGQPGRQGIDGRQGQQGATGQRGFIGATGFPGRDGSSGQIGNIGLEGRTGATGRRGLDGRPGQTGATGRQGSAGIIGRGGFEGRTGATGQPGQIGFPGNTGATGLSGRGGATGSPGRTGATGQRGFPGRDGETGSPGRNGNPGAAGATGIPGLQGRVGTVGRPGVDGRDGAIGESGRDGQTGATGRAGLSGRDGGIGFTGQPGRDGRPGQVGETGRPGKTGATGRDGVRGFPGAKGLTGSTGASGLPGLVGRIGSTGQNGLPGRDGRIGDTGSSGREGRIGSEGRAGETGLPGLMGRDGRQGDTGLPGLDGRFGAPGATGFPGRDGRIGDTGRSGPAGSRGLPGLDGRIGAIGQRGLDGLDGKTGATGIPGIIGSPGERGFNGRDGAPGLSGATGLRGFDGLPGNDGRPGATGVPGQRGFDGAFGSTGRSGKTGATGLPGFDGRVGATGFSGRDGIGRDGVIGATGQRGSFGLSGRDGRTGATGLNGRDGRTGATGREGRDGFPGVPGVGKTGATGLPGFAGAAGPRGFDGQRGANGQDGRSGATGPAGSPGIACMENECNANNGGCDQLCVDTYESFYCTCTPGFKPRSTPIVCPGVARLCSSVLDLVFVVDTSGSIKDRNPNDWTVLLDFIKGLVNGLPIGFDQTRVGVVSFSNAGYSEFYLNTFYDKTSVMNAVDRIRYEGGNTNTSGGIREMMFNQFVFGRGDRPDVENVAIVITDGQSTFDRFRTVADAREAHSRAIRMFSVGVTSEIDEQELRDISSPPSTKGRNYFTSASFAALNDIQAAVLKETCDVQDNENFYCEQTSLENHQCFCRYSECDIRPTNGTQCDDIDECLLYNGGCQQICRNEVGSYKCECERGYTLRGDFHTCKDVNECLNNPCRAGELCTNTYGSYVCVPVSGQFGLTAEETAPESTGFGLGSVVGTAVLSALVVLSVAVIVVLSVRLLSRRKANFIPDKMNKFAYGIKPYANPSVDMDESFSSLSNQVNY